MKTRVRWNRHTWALLAVAVGMWYAAEAQSNGAAHVMALLTIALGGLSWLHARANLRGLSVRLLGARPVAQAEAARIPVELRATGAAACCGLEVFAVGAGASVFVERVPAGGVVTLNLPPPTTTAAVPLEIVVRSVYPLGFFTAQGVLRTEWLRRVHPKPGGSLPLPSPRHSVSSEPTQAARVGSKQGGGEDFAGLREFTPGDSPRHIDWRALARGGPLMVKSWNGAAPGVVVLDWSVLTLEPEARVAQLAQWISRCEVDGQPYELRLPGQVLRAGLGPQQQRRCMDALATLAAHAGEGGLESAGLKADPQKQVLADELLFEKSTHLPALPLLMLCVAMLAALWPLLGKVASAGLVVCAASLLWRGVLRRPAPPRLVRMGVLMAGVVGVYLENGTLRGMEPGIALLLVLAGVKALESQTPREFQVLALIGWFLAFCSVLIDSQLARALGMVAVFLCIAACMVRFRRSVPGMREPAWVTGTLFAQALPVVLLLFLVVPRGLLNISALGRGNFGQTGLDNTLDPGSVARIALSSGVAFRVRFPDGDPPPNANCYWRCLTLWNCDFLRWTRGARLGYQTVESSKPKPGDVRQIIDLEAHGRTWVPALDRPVVATVRGARGYPEFDQTLVSPVPLTSSVRLEVLSRLPPAVMPEKPPVDLVRHHRDAALQLPEKGAPRVRALVDSWLAVTQEDEQLVQLAINHLRTQGFTYALDPGEYPPGPAGLEDFLFNRRTGFCEHFSAAFATLMRQAGVPSRLVVGYLGGEYSDHNGGYLIVKQSEVHAWTEVWLKRYGWWRVDPTAALAPDRINIDLRAWLAGGGEAAERQRRSLWWRLSQRTRLLWDSLSYAWESQVIDFNEDLQRDFMESLGLGSSRLLLLGLTLGVALLGGGSVALWLRRPTRVSDPWLRAWQKVGVRLVKAGAPRQLASEGPLDYTQRVAVARPDVAEPLQQLAQLYAAGRYGATGAGSLGLFRLAVGRFKPKRKRP